MTPIKETPHFYRDVIIGIGDGITIPLAAATAMSAITNNEQIILITGACVAVAGAIAMSAGGYLAGKGEELQFRHGASSENEEKEVEQTRILLSSLGLGKDIQEQASNEIIKDQSAWNNFTGLFEPVTTPAYKRNPARSAVNIGLAFLVGGMIPVIPYNFFDIANALKISVCLSLISIFIYGYFKSRLIGYHPWIGAVRALVICAAVAGSAYIVAGIFI